MDIIEYNSKSLKKSANFFINKEYKNIDSQHLYDVIEKNQRRVNEGIHSLDSQMIGKSYGECYNYLLKSKSKKALNEITHAANYLITFSSDINFFIAFQDSINDMSKFAAVFPKRGASPSIISQIDFKKYLPHFSNTTYNYLDKECKQIFCNAIIKEGMIHILEENFKDIKGFIIGDKKNLGKILNGKDYDILSTPTIGYFIYEQLKDEDKGSLDSSMVQYANECNDYYDYNPKNIYFAQDIESNKMIDDGIIMTVGAPDVDIDDCNVIDTFKNRGYTYDSNTQTFLKNEQEVSLESAREELEEIRDNVFVDKEYIAKEYGIKDIGSFDLKGEEDGDIVDMYLKGYENRETVEDNINETVSNLYYEFDEKGDYIDFDDEDAIEFLTEIIQEVHQRGELALFYKSTVNKVNFKVIQGIFTSIIQNFPGVKREKFLHIFLGDSFNETSLRNPNIPRIQIETTIELVIDFTNKLYEQYNISLETYYDIKRFQDVLQDESSPELRFKDYSADSFWKQGDPKIPFNTQIVNSSRIFSKLLFNDCSEVNTQLLELFLLKQGKTEFFNLCLKEEKLDKTLYNTEFESEFLDNIDLIAQLYINKAGDYHHSKLHRELFENLSPIIQNKVIVSMSHIIKDIYINEKENLTTFSFSNIKYAFTKNLNIVTEVETILEPIINILCPHHELLSDLIYKMDGDNRIESISYLLNNSADKKLNAVLVTFIKNYGNIIPGFKFKKGNTLFDIVAFCEQSKLDTPKSVISQILLHDDISANQFSNLVQTCKDLNYNDVLITCITSKYWEHIKESDDILSYLLDNSLIDFSHYSISNGVFIGYIKEIVTSASPENLEKYIRLINLNSEFIDQERLLELLIKRSDDIFNKLSIETLDPLFYGIQISIFYQNWNHILRHTYNEGNNRKFSELLEQYFIENFNLTLRANNINKHHLNNIRFSDAYLKDSLTITCGGHARILNIHAHYSSLSYKQLHLFINETTLFEFRKILGGQYAGRLINEDRNNNFELLIIKFLQKPNIEKDLLEYSLIGQGDREMFLQSFFQFLRNGGIRIADSFKDTFEIIHEMTDIQSHMIQTEQYNIFYKLVSKYTHSSFLDLLLTQESNTTMSSTDFDLLLPLLSAHEQNKLLEILQNTDDSYNALLHFERFIKVLGKENTLKLFQSLKSDTSLIPFSHIELLSNIGYSKDEINTLIHTPVDGSEDDYLLSLYKEGQNTITDIARVVLNQYDIFEESGLELEDLLNYRTDALPNPTITTIQKRNEISFKYFSINKERFNNYGVKDEFSSNGLDTDSILWTLENSLYQQYKNLIGDGDNLGKLTGSVISETLTNNTHAGEVYKLVLKDISKNIIDIHKGIGLSIQESGLKSHNIESAIQEATDKGDSIKDTLSSGHECISKACLFKNEFVNRLNNTDKIIFEKSTKYIENLISKLYSEGILDSKSVDSINKHLFYVDISPIQKSLQELKSVCLPGLKDSFILKKSEIKETNIRAALKGLTFNKLCDGEIRSLCSFLKDAPIDDRKTLSNIIKDLKSVLIINKLSDNCSNERLNNFKTIFHRNFITHPVFKESFKEEISTLEYMLINDNKDIGSFIYKVSQLNHHVDNKKLDSLFEYAKGIENVVEHYKTIQEEVRSHLDDDFGNINIDEIKLQEVNKNDYSISLWNRDDIITNLNQGHYTHCCIAPNGENAWSLPYYIVSENFNIIEIKSEGRIVGQAFCYIGATEDDTCNLVIDNVEINNTFSGDSKLIKERLEAFTIQYRDYIGSLGKEIKIGNNYNDIEVTGEMTTVSTIIGDDCMYLDSESSQRIFTQ